MTQMFIDLYRDLKSYYKVCFGSCSDLSFFAKIV